MPLFSRILLSLKGPSFDFYEAPAPFIFIKHYIRTFDVISDYIAF